MKQLPVFICVVLLCSIVPVSGADFGLILTQTPDLSLAGGEKSFTYRAKAVPWLSASPIENLNLYFSISLTGEFEKVFSEADRSGEWQNPLFEAARFSAAFKPAPTFFLEAGRVQWSDASCFIASGLFDGLNAAYIVNGFRFSAACLYTGLLHKESANIKINVADMVDYTDSETFFASRRVLGSLSFSTPPFGGFIDSVGLEALAQFDLNGRDSKTHTQYAVLKTSLSPIPKLSVSLAGVLGFLENSENDKPEISYAGEADAYWAINGALPGLISFGAAAASGGSGEVGAFTPVSTIDQGFVLTPDFSGLAKFSLAYTLRLIESLSIEVKGAYLFRTGKTIFSDPALDPSGGNALGSELLANVVFVPFPDLALQAKAGVFIPSTGNAFAGDAPVKARFSLSLALSF
ncbi:MAG: hypothetical protein LBL44_04405 [Treponema sp.]|jgi:hypothetical protein|nr:hypothetical protein [Treponema sp.]